MTAAATRPSHGAAFTAMYSVLLRSQIRTGRLLGLGALALLAIILGAVAGTGSNAVEDAVSVQGSFGLSVVVPVGALLIASSTLGDLVEDRSLLYFTLRPVPRWLVALAGWAAAVTITVPAVVVPMLLAAVFAGDGGVLVGAGLSSLLGTLAYVGLFLFVGLVLKRALIWGLAYILIWEGFVATAGAGVARLAVRSYTRSILSTTSDVDLRLADRSTAAAIIVPILVAVVGVVLTARSLAGRDID
ncbi:MAG: hypothetical protein AAGA99_17185 [Actinomycetota bacterium]